MKHKTSFNWLAALVLATLLLSFGLTSIPNAQSPPGALEKWSTTAGDDPLTPVALLDYPPDPTADIPWSAGDSGVADIQAAFNNARSIEGASLPMLSLPSQTAWDTMSDGEKALWLINKERIDRGVHPLHGLETNVSGVAQYYAQYLIDHNAWGHTADGRDPWQRLNANPAIGACHDFLNVAENLAAFWTSGSSIPLPIEQSVYNWMYDDGSCCAWGHRHAVLWYPYDDNSGPAGMEGFLGIGRAGSSTYDPYGWGWVNWGEVVVMNVFDPCATWNYVVDRPYKVYLPSVLKNR
jgi:uncharacterized protein YkwD